MAGRASTSTYRRAALAFVLASPFLGSVPSGAFVHLWDIAEIYSNEDGSVQFVELFTKSSSEPFTEVSMLDSDANTVILEGPVGDTTDRSFLIATPGFAQLQGGVTPDTTMPVAPFFAVEGDTLIFQNAFIVEVYDTVVLLSGDLPLDGVLSWNRVNPGGTTAADPPGGFTIEDNSPTNYARDAGHLMLPEPRATLLGLLAAAGLAHTRRAPRAGGERVARECGGAPTQPASASSPTAGT